MQHEIRNGNLSVKVLSKGAELCSLKNLDTNTEHIWQANPKIWSSHAPNLFPVIGLLKNGSYFYEGKEFQMPKHGFVRHNENLKLKEKKEDSLIFQLISSEKTLAYYPFEFIFEIGFFLKGRTLTVSHKVINRDDKMMFFSLGGHPAFNAPLYKGETYEDYYLEFDRKMDLDTYVLNRDGLVTDRTEVIARNDNTIRLHRNLFDNDALIFKDISSKKVALKSERSGAVITVEYENFRNLGIWAKPGAPFVCIEPWLGIADVEETTGDIKTKEGINKLMPSESFNAFYSITIE